ncbi:thrombospondin type-1 domain-containing protein 4-like isoform X2 [Mya arenaria]|uniref:thrombospondin type-1 domain-containing protein 4-like isoform X2 n=1 Tax=Mya arenaria TaxID=6604 RepID=UPI0022E70974|nr:thrombospondin type-1 domain-containing protein 4-like isoform X2 [Mya arenaria]
MALWKTVGYLAVLLYVVGCDGVVGSGLREDHCGVCGGDNDSCRVIAGIFTRSHLEYGYNHITRIPQGACHVNVTELAYSRNYLVLKYTNGTGILNSDRSMIKGPGLYKGAGTTFSYGKRAGPGCPGECVYTAGPLSQDLDIQLLTYRRNTGIKYFFTVPKDMLEEIMTRISPSTNRRHPTSGIGQDHKPSVGVGSAGPQINFQKEPEYVASENQRTAYQAFKSNGQSYDTQSAIDRYRQGYTAHTNTISSDLVQDSNARLPSYETHSSQQVAGSGVRYGQVPNRVNTIPDSGYNSGYYDSNRNVYYGNNGNTIPSQKQKLEVPNTFDDVNFHWTISGFTECSTTCGGGMQDTKVVCMKRKSNLIVTDENCDPAKKNVQTVVCNKSPCPPDWEGEPWSVCSRTCGVGVQTRQVECRQRYSENMSVPITASLCNFQARPETSRSCEAKPCAQWRTSNWTKCSVECGLGQLTRDVDCANTEAEQVPDQECAGPKPEASQSCDMGTCAKGWFHTPWVKKCTSSCGRGYVTRSLYCLAEDGSQLPETKCGKKPRAKKSCRSNRPCGGSWFEGPWSECSSTCGTAVQSRDVVCIKKLDKKLFAVVEAVNCKRSSKPDTSRPCPGLPECPAQWHMTHWTQCTQTCGTGLKTRDIKCMGSDARPSSTCLANKRPSLRRTCNTQDCSLPQLDEDPACKDNVSQNCQKIVQSRLCPYQYFKDQCCHSCRLHHLHHQQQQQDEAQGS